MISNYSHPVSSRNSDDTFMMLGGLPLLVVLAVVEVECITASCVGSHLHAYGIWHGISCAFISEFCSRASTIVLPT